ncbi:MAG TPA: hypothetical protein EYN79_02335 [Planctomycetes bacterium]|nr:hypothetical protein [Planctomycetota bacterium]HIN80983.1 hypothetical protein [Planctomycetota bacterium]
MRISPSLILAFALWLAAAGLVGPIDELRRRDNLTWKSTDSTGVPADVRMLQQALGSFRGWAIDALWLRAQNLLEKGEVHEAMQLADWITRLQPHFPKVWNFQAWNLAFNIALDARDPAERWTWVDAGISLLRDRGLQSNPRSREIHRQLSYFFWFKLGENTDEMHRYYKWQVARIWNGILGPSCGVDGAVKELKMASVAPRSITELIEERPALAGVEKAISAQLEDPQLLADGWNLARFEEEVRIDGISREDLLILEAFFRRHILEGRHRMDPELMSDLVTILGPIDWRLPGAHAIYWSVRGTLVSEDSRGSEGAGEKPLLPSQLYPAMLDSGAQIGLQQLVQSGRLHFDEAAGIYRTFPQWRLLDSLFRVVRTTFTDPESEGVPRPYRENFRTLLVRAALAAWRQGDDESAMRCRESLRELGVDDSEKTWSLDRWVEEKVRISLSSDQEPGDRIVGMLGQAILDGVSGGDPMGIERTSRLALLLHAELFARGAAPDISEVRRLALRGLLRAPSASIGIGLKAEIWARVPAAERSRVDKVTRLILMEQGELEGVDFTSEFPGLDSDVDEDKMEENPGAVPVRDGEE